MSAQADPLTDRQLLEMLDLLEGQGMTRADIGARFGFSSARARVIFQRIFADLAASEVGSTVTRPENRDGGMARGWWRK